MPDDVRGSIPGCALVLTCREFTSSRKCNKGHARSVHEFMYRIAVLTADMTAHKDPQRDVTEWLSARSGPSKDYVEKIMVVKVSPDSPGSTPESQSQTSSSTTNYSIRYCPRNYQPTTLVGRRLYVTVLFNSTANCFEAMRQITERKINDRYVVEDVTCPRGCFRTLTMHPKDARYVNECEVRALLRPYGEVYSLGYLKSNGVRTGQVRVVMLVLPPPADKLSECDKDKKLFEKIDNEAFDLSGGRVSLQFVKKMWKEHGPK